MNSEDNRMPVSTVLTISAAFAIVFLVLFMWVGGFGFWGAFLWGLLIGIAVFVILMFVFAGPAGSDVSSVRTIPARGTPEAAPRSTGDGASSKPGDDKPAASGKGEAAGKPAGASAGNGRTGGSGAASVAASAATGAADATEPGAGGAAGARPAMPDPGAGGAAAVEAAAGDGDKAPGALSGPRGGAPDNLKEIKGVGPKLESMLHDMGVYHLDQIAGWGPAEVAWADENLKGFKGRVSRDDWVGQAKVLAAGGETEFSKKVDKGGVY